MKIKCVFLIIFSAIFNIGCGDIENADPRKMSERSSKNDAKSSKASSRVATTGVKIRPATTIVGGDDNEDDDGTRKNTNDKKEFNHGDHNDSPWKLEQEGSFGCGNLSLSSCSSAAHVEKITAQACRDAVSDDTDLGLPLNQSYIHSINSIGRVLKAEYINNGQGSFSYKMDIKYTCSGYIHPASLVICPAPPAPC